MQMPLITPIMLGYVVRNSMMAPAWVIPSPVIVTWISTPPSILRRCIIIRLSSRRSMINTEKLEIQGTQGIQGILGIKKRLPPPMRRFCLLTRMPTNVRSDWRWIPLWLWPITKARSVSSSVPVRRMANPMTWSIRWLTRTRYLSAIATPCSWSLASQPNPRKRRNGGMSQLRVWPVCWWWFVRWMSASVLNTPCICRDSCPMWVICSASVQMGWWRRVSTLPLVWWAMDISIRLWIIIGYWWVVV